MRKSAELYAGDIEGYPARTGNDRPREGHRPDDAGAECELIHRSISSISQCAAGRRPRFSIPAGRFFVDHPDSLAG